MSLQDLVEQAMKTNLDLKLTKSAVENKKAGILSAKSNYDWNLSASYTWDRDNTPTSSSLDGASGSSSVKSRNRIMSLGLTKNILWGTEFSFNYSNTLNETGNTFSTIPRSHNSNFTISATQPLIKTFFFSSFKNSLKEAKFDWRAAGENLKNEIDEIIFKTIELAFDHLESTKSLEIKKMALNNAKTNYEYAKKRKKLGRISKVDLLDAKANWLTKKNQLSEAEIKVKETKTLLTNHVYGDFEVLDDFKVELKNKNHKIPKLDIESMSKTALKQRKDYKEQLINVKKSRLSLNDAKINRLPELDLKLENTYAGIGVKGSDAFDQVKKRDFKSWETGLTLTSPIMRYAKRASYKMKKLQLRQEQIKLLKLKKEILFESYKNYEKLKSSNERTRALQAALEAEREKKRAIRAKFRSGKASLTDYLQSLEEHEQAEIDHLKASLSQEKNYYQLYKSLGSLSSKFAKKN